MSRTLALLAALCGVTAAQLDAFNLPNPQRYAPKPTVPPELRSFFELDGHARELVDSLIGQGGGAGGFFPEKTFEIGSQQAAQGLAGPPHKISTLERTLESLFTAPEQANSGPALPPGFGQGGFSLANNNKNLLSSNKDAETEKVTIDETEGSGHEIKSSIGGIPKVFPKLPKAPIAAPGVPAVSRPQPIAVADVPIVPAFISSPDVPEGGFAPSSDIRRAPQSVSAVASNSVDEPINTEEYGGLAEETSTGSGGLIGTIMNLIGLGNKKSGQQEDKQALGKAVSNLIGGENSPLPAKNVLSNVLYKALTAGSVQNNETVSSDGEEGEKKNLTLTAAQSNAIGEQLKMIQNLVIQPTSPLCTSKPEPVDFDFNSFLGQWYQVLYSPPLSSGPCSMVLYKKLSDVNNGGAGSIFEIFEYTTDGTPYSKPKISNGYSLVKAPGELIYKTNSNQEDVNVHVIHLGPKNSAGEYEYIVLSTNCNYPVYAFARDPVQYKQKYEAEVTEVLERKGIINGFSRLLNIVAPVDNSICSFPPSIFNMMGK
ncbi:lpr-5 [Pristionchus pacificus]|nr:lpr-5 [Pristionchus pacificus]